MKWLFGGKEEATPALSRVDLEKVRAEALAVLFKHSNSCPVSWAAEREVKRFQAAAPDVPVYTLVVQEDRPLSNRVAQEMQIRHESPQVIILRHGQPVAHASHEQISAEYLASVTK